ncbi:Peroxisomal membrane signal receptor PTS1 [Blyttiomyces sp. JEL0837]|nr:Peroxisomal membrane signal receptor PTS1 [Blyttiomyces sp. JEL0837]
MSFEAVVGGGAECGPGPNQLNRFVKHMHEGDNLLQDHHHMQGPDGGLIAGSSSQRPGRFVELDDKQFVDEFFKSQQGMDGRGPPPGMHDAFQFRGMHAELEGVLDQGPMGADWASDFERFQSRMPANARDAEFEAAFNSAMRAAPPGDWSQEFSRQNLEVQDPEFEQFQRAFDQHQHVDEAFEREWSDQFTAVTQSLDVKGKGKAIAGPNDVEAMMESWKQEFEKTGELKSLDGDGNEWMEKFQDVWKGMSDKEEAFKEWQSEYEDYLPSGNSIVDPDPVTAPLAEYKFEADNPFLSHADPLGEGLKIMREGGSLSQAALAFEAAVQRDPQNSDAWMHLGHAQAENEKENPAIAALQRSVQENPKNLPALLSLAISYTNEGRELEAYASLERWISTKYPGVTENSPLPKNEMLAPYELHERSTKFFIEAVRRGPMASSVPVPESTELDPDVQVGLGVLFYNRSEFDKAIDCFTSALSARPKDYLLWNRLGATLANSGKSEEAIDAYYKALELRPTFVRCRYNLGVSCINIGCYKEAAEHLLGALSLHVVGGDGTGAQANVSENLWETLRRTFLQMERKDLADMTYGERDVAKFRKEFEF